MFPNDIICMKDFFLPSRHIDILNHIVFSKLHCFMPTVYEGVVETICDFMPEWLCSKNMYLHVLRGWLAGTPQWRRIIAWKANASNVWWIVATPNRRKRIAQPTPSECQFKTVQHHSVPEPKLGPAGAASWHSAWSTDSSMCAWGISTVCYQQRLAVSVVKNKQPCIHFPLILTNQSFRWSCQWLVCQHKSMRPIGLRWSSVFEYKMSSSENVLVWFGRTEKSKEEQRQTSGSEIQPLSDVDSAMASIWGAQLAQCEMAPGWQLTAHRSSMNEGLERFGIRTVGIGWDWGRERHGTGRWYSVILKGTLYDCYDMKEL